MSVMAATLPPATDLARKLENGVGIAALVAMSALPAVEILLRATAGIGIPGTAGYVQNLTLWVGFIGAMIAAREDRHLHLAVARLPLPPAAARAVEIAVHTISAAVAVGLLWANLKFVQSELLSAQRIGPWLPVWIAEAILPLCFLVIALRFVLRVDGWPDRLAVVLGVAAIAAAVFVLQPVAEAAVAPAIGLLVLAALLRAPIFVMLGGITLVLFFAEGVPAAAVAVSSYRIAVSPLIPTIPLFTLVGYLLAEGGARRRLLRLFQAWFGWMPGGEAIVATLLCAFFTTFTGASGVVILAVGGLLLPLLLSRGYPDRFAVGLLTASGSIGLLFPPSIAVIIYATMTYVPIPDMFLAGLVPGTIMVAAVCLFGVWQARHAGVERTAFDPREAGRAALAAGWELLIPVIVLVGVFGGYATLTEAAAIAVLYVLVVEVAIHGDIDPAEDLPRILVDCLCLIGGVFAILAVAFGLANYFVDAGIPDTAADWVAAHVDSRVVFLLCLNVFLLIVGCLMDIFSAIVVIAPLILPTSQLFGIHPAHLGIIFLANLELGYLTPPVGMNLFLAAYRFDRGMMEICRSALPFFGLLLIVVLLITYVPAFTLIGAG